MSLLPPNCRWFLNYLYVGLARYMLLQTGENAPRAAILDCAKSDEKSMLKSMDRRGTLLGLLGTGLFSNVSSLFAPHDSLAFAAERSSTVHLRDSMDISTKQEYASGNFLTSQTVINSSLPREQSIAVDLGSFPKNTVMSWSWPAAADDQVKSWNAIFYGDYLNTKTPEPVPSSRIKDIMMLDFEGKVEYSAPHDSSNIALDLFLYNTNSSNFESMLCEIQVFMHVPPSTLKFIESLEHLGTYVSRPRGRSARIDWSVARQDKNFFGKPYYIFYPQDSVQNLSATIDILSIFRWLQEKNARTGVVYLTGQEYFNGLGLGVEVLKKKGAINIKDMRIEYKQKS